jgi:uncharacterized protein GlcG (DUF336 family)
MEGERKGLRRLLRPAVLTIAAGALLIPFLPAPPAGAVGVPLTPAEIQDLVSRCVHFARLVRGADPLSVAVVDVEGNSLGVFHMTGSTGCRSVALAKASTASYFTSDQGSFSTRTAAFIIQDHFPPGLRFSPGGPLYGVEFSGLGTSDVNPVYFPGPVAGANCLNQPLDTSPLPEAIQARVRGELGGVALFKGGMRVGGIAVDDGGDDRITLPTAALLAPGSAYRLTYSKLDRGRDMEKVVMAAARAYLPPRPLRADKINLGGFRIPYGRGTPLRAATVPPVVPGLDGDWDPDYPPRDPVTLPSRFAALTVNPPPGAGAGAQSIDGFRPLAFPVVPGTDGFLTAPDVERILWQGARVAGITRGAIRRPIGLAMQCWVSVVDTKGEVLGVLRTPDATLFSYDVAVQKARTAVLFSDGQAAWSTRALGEFAQAFYPAGQQQTGLAGPLYQLQDGVSAALLAGALGSPADGRFRNGVTIFPGGVPLYAGGVLVGAVGVSGDGVDQDDLIAWSGSEGFRPPEGIRCDHMGRGALRGSLGRGVDRLEAAVPGGPAPDPVAQATLDFLADRILRCRGRLSRMDLDVGPPFVKLPRHPGPVTER